MIENIEEYFTKGCGRCNRFATSDCSTRKWAKGLAILRNYCTDAGLVETVKWGHPCYMQGQRNIAILGAFRDDFRLNFFNPALMKDARGVLEKQGPNMQNAGMIRFTSNDQVAEMKPVIVDYLEEAMGYAVAGILPPKTVTTFELPDELIEALNADPELAEAFHALTRGRQKSYAINLNAAKKPETRVARIAKFRDHILSGKGALER